MVERGTPGSVRVDVAQGPIKRPTAVFDLKTGSAKLSSAREAQLRAHLPGGANIPITVIRPGG